MELTKYEEVLLGLIEEAKTYVPSNCELEIDHVENEFDDEMTGWYAYKYNGSEATPIEANDYETIPLIADDTVRRFRIDIHKVFQKAHVFVCG